MRARDNDRITPFSRRFIASRSARLPSQLCCEARHPVSAPGRSDLVAGSYRQGRHQIESVPPERGRWRPRKDCGIRRPSGHWIIAERSRNSSRSPVTLGRRAIAVCLEHGKSCGKPSAQPSFLLSTAAVCQLSPGPGPAALHPRKVKETIVPAAALFAQNRSHSSRLLPHLPKPMYEAAS